MKGQLFRALVVVATSVSTAAQAADLIVPTDYQTIAAALEAAQPGDRVRIQPGTYLESDLILPSGIVVGGTGTEPTDVVIDAHETGRVFLAESNFSVGHIENLTLSRGRAEGPTSYDQSGGALLVNNGNLTVTRCVFRDNTALAHGGAIRATNATLIIDSTRFENNAAPDGGGGAIDCSYQASPLIRDCTFRGNQASWGGALSCRANSSPIVAGCFFESNEAVGERGFGGAVFTDSEAQPEFTRTTFFRNSARYGGALACFQESATNLSNCTLVENASAVEGGGLFTNDASPIVACSIIAYQVGTGISAQGTSIPAIENTDLYGNSAGDWTGMIADLEAADGNLATDPMFCDANPEGDFALQPGSPVAEPSGGCEYLGAWPVACQVTPVVLGRFEAVWHEGAVRLAWHINLQDEEAPAFLLTGATQEDPDREWVVEYRNDSSGSYSGLDDRSKPGRDKAYHYRLYIPDGTGGWSLVGETTLKSAPVLPGIHNLLAAPNPFNPTTTIRFEVGRRQQARVAIYGLDGKRVRVLADRILEAGTHDLPWDGLDATGRRAASGSYVVVIDGETQTKTFKMTMLK